MTDREMLTIQRSAKLARILGSPARLRILMVLREEALCVTSLAERIGRLQANVSQHLMVLRAAGLVVSEREGMRIRYRIRDPRVLGLVDRLTDLAHSLDELDADEVMQRKSCRKGWCDSAKRGRFWP